MAAAPEVDPLIATLLREAENGDAIAALKLARICDLNGDHQRGLAWLRHAAVAGSPQALTTLGARLLIGRAAPFAPRRGARLIAEAAKQDFAEALHLAAALAAAGIGRPQGWADAYDSLTRVAVLDDPRGRRQIEVLRQIGVTSVDAITQWIAAPRPVKISDAPFIARYPGFLEAPVCAYLIERTASKLSAARVYDADQGGRREDEMRTNTGAGFSIIDADFIVQLVRARIAHAAGVAPPTLEASNVLHYAVGEQYEAHYDFFNPEAPLMADHVRLYGQRTQTFLVYLNGGAYAGGETDFPALNMKISGAAGEGLLFHNIHEGKADHATLHAGLPPTSGEKWLLSQWIRDRAMPPA